MGIRYFTVPASSIYFHFVYTNIPMITFIFTVLLQSEAMIEGPQKESGDAKISEQPGLIM